MYSHSAYSRATPKPKTPKNGDVSNIFRMPAPLSPTFITTQSLARPGMPADARKRERVSSSSGIYNANRQTPISPKMVSDGRTKQFPPTTVYNGAAYGGSQLQSTAMTLKDEENDMNLRGYEGRSEKSRNEVQRVSRAQVYLPGDHVIFAESPSAPGIPIVYRLEEERRSNPDKLNLDRRKLSSCPILEGEENLRLLNYQHNLIKKIEHLELLRKLIFLDLYDNQIEEMSGLASLKLLRVLMLGKNRVTQIANLQELIMLDVLDLHGNQITKIENVDHLKHLRVLNLAGNQLTTVENLAGLSSLSELNLRRNSIQSVHTVDKLPALQRLFLSFNNIKHFNDVSCLGKAPALIELSLDGNPFSKCSDYKQLIIQNVSNLRQLDMKRLTDEEKRFAYIAAKREEDKQRESERLSSLKEKRHIAISNAQRQWNQQVKSTKDEPQLPSLNSCEALERKSPARVSPRESFDVEQCPLKGVDRVKSLSTSHLAELENNSLNLYGSGSLEALDKDWGEKVISSVTTINFKYINFTDIVPHLCKLCRTFASLRSLNFDMTNISSLNQLNMFSLLPWIDNLHIIPAGNPVTNLSIWKPYVLYRLEHAQLKTLNDEDITRADILHASNLFEPVSQVVTTKLPKHRQLMLQANYRNLAVHDLHTNSLWFDVDCSDAAKTESVERKQFAGSYVNEIVQNGILGDRKMKLLEECWDKFVLDMVKTSLAEMEDQDAYCEASLEKMRKL